MRFCIAFLFAVCLSQSLSGQGIKLTGKVTDSQGAIIVGANVTAISIGGKRSNAKTVYDGIYELELIEGKYRLEFDAVGFKPATVHDFIVESLSRTTSQDLVLIGSNTHEPCGYGGDCGHIEEVRAEKVVVSDKIIPRPLIDVPKKPNTKIKKQKGNY